MIMRIFLISNMYPGEMSPVFGTFVKVIDDGLSDRGCEIAERVVISRQGGCLPVKAFRYVGFYIRAIFRLVVGKYDLVYGHYLSHVAFPLFLAKRLFAKKVVIHIHGSDVMKASLMRRVTTWMIRHVVHDADLIVVPSEAFKCIVLDTYKVDADAIFVSPSGGVDLDTFSPAAPADGPDAVTLRLGYVSRIDSEKGWDVLLDGLSILNERGGRAFHCHILGDGPQRTALVEGMRVRGLTESVTYLGAKPHQELPAHYRQFDVFVFPTLRESLGLVAIEAMACGVPVIASRISTLEEYVDDNVNGFLFTPGDAADLADKIEAFMKLPTASRREMRRHAVETAKRYDQATVAHALTARFNQLLSQ